MRKIILLLFFLILTAGCTIQSTKTVNYPDCKDMGNGYKNLCWATKDFANHQIKLLLTGHRDLAVETKQFNDLQLSATLYEYSGYPVTDVESGINGSYEYILKAYVFPENLLPKFTTDQVYQSNNIIIESAPTLPLERTYPQYLGQKSMDYTYGPSLGYMEKGRVVVIDNVIYHLYVIYGSNAQNNSHKMDFNAVLNSFQVIK